MRQHDRPARALPVAALAALALLVAPDVAAAAPAAGPGAPVCEVRDRRLNELSGLGVVGDGFVAVNDGSDEESHRRIFFLDADCSVTRAVRYPSPPRDTEDLTVAPDGTVWVADIGDNDRDRQTVGVWQLRPGASRPVLYRMAYPDRAHDAEAMLVTGDGRPLIVTKSTGTLYAPATTLRAGGVTPLVKLGEVRLPSTTTRNPFSFVGRTLVTGAATARDGKRVVLRTYADAFEFDVPDGDVVRALTTGTPRGTPLPDEPQGESVTYGRDGRSLLTVSESAGEPAGDRPVIRRYALSTSGEATTPAGAATTTGAATATAPAEATGAAAVAAADGARARERGSVGFGAAAALGLGVFALGLAGLLRARRSGRR
ncbi:NHL repeat-containing protein [Micromonospora siamensis]|uniref:Esterase-like activity of phytase n=1 Tax=Micromonospora siamensis TaxID=299152 RepID=A0A1C5HX87_9ACTN|nr:hypothetical protein [Micromonospora siamensis]SCG50685.1 hypothetical protein GA0074704_2529 [Micromonospora siamensis]